MSFQSWKDGSRANWGITKEEQFTREEIQLGAILRIADAVELMAKNHDQLVRERDWSRNDAQRLRDDVEKLRRSNASLRGHLNRKRRAQGKDGAT